MGLRGMGYSQEAEEAPCTATVIVNLQDKAGTKSAILEISTALDNRSGALSPLMLEYQHSFTYKGFFQKAAAQSAGNENTQ